MTEINRHRIKFYSKQDGAIVYELKKSEEVLDDYNNDSELGLVDLIEFYNIKLHFDNQLFLSNWTDETKTAYKEKVETVSKVLNKRILKINDNTLETELKSLDYNYFDNFWGLINNLGAYKNISEKSFAELLLNNQRQIYYILSQKKIVEKFDNAIRDFLMHYKSSAEIILSSIEEKDTFRNKKSNYFPKSLSLSDKETIINKYLDIKEPNLNYVRLIENSMDSNEFKLNTKTRLKAKKKSEELNINILQQGNSINIGIAVSFKKNQIEPVRFNSENTNIEEVSYSESFIDQFQDNINLFRIFKYLFLYTDCKNLISLVSKPSELEVFERTFMKSKNEYETGFAFQRKENLANMQLLIYDHYLKRKGNNIEALINSYIDFINEKIEPHKLIFKIALTDKSYLEKIRTIAIDFEVLFKQYKTFVDEKNIDWELIQINSNPIRFGEIYSSKDKKYFYSNNNLILQLKFLFFSDQSSLYYIEHFGNKYHNLFDLLTNENVKLEYFANYQKDTIESLIKDEYLKIDNQENVVINKYILIFIIGEIHNNEVISYWNYSNEIRVVVDELAEKKLLISENTLLTRQERNYFNYYLNKKEFTNGFDLRNKYLHGTNSFSENDHKIDYYRLIKIIILTLFKIEDDITKIEQ